MLVLAMILPCPIYPSIHPLLGLRLKPPSSSGRHAYRVTLHALENVTFTIITESPSAPAPLSNLAHIHTHGLRHPIAKMIKNPS